ncbi:hypothetical protein VNI00_010027 [Paramarasmius palmivorus]|uniref:Uncharacterized protein n=1 Tax=Paramarasmius palmivorus TaxID=297713 RepID=A0AAW0CKU6_9AGAR
MTVSSLTAANSFKPDECKTLDAGLGSGYSSSLSSTLSSPHLGFAGGDHDVPALIPSQLGSALNGHHSHYSISSSSASSTSWSLVTDDDPYINGNDNFLNSSADPGSFDGILKGSSTPGCPSYLTPLSYARRPSGTNNGSSASRAYSGHVRSAPRSAPIHYRSHPSTDDDDSSDFGQSSRDIYEPGYPRTAPDDQTKSTIKKAKRSRNRASLPAHFSLLQVSGTSPSVAVTLPVSSVGHRPSPPTPKSSLSGLTAARPNPAAALPSVTPRTGRKREPPRRFDEQFSSPSPHSRSRSPSRSNPGEETTPSIPQVSYRARLESQGSKGSSVEKLFDWTSEQLKFPRGRQAVRRNSSPPPKMILNMLAMDVTSTAPPTSRHRKADSTSSSRQRQRGRQKNDELDGFGGCSEAPGYGNGRSGLLDREQRAGVRHGLR